MKNRKKTILLDLDGVLNEYNGDYNPLYIPSIRKGAADFLKKLSKGYQIKLFTVRDKMLVSIWIIENNLQYYISEVTNVKESAWLIVDDRCICFDGEYSRLLDSINNFKVWYKKEIS